MNKWRGESFRAKVSFFEFGQRLKFFKLTDCINNTILKIVNQCEFRCIEEN